MKKEIIAPIFIVSILVLFFCGNVSALDLTVGTGTGATNETVQIEITVSNSENVAGAAFTLTIDNNITLTGIQSTFFDIFENQWNEIVPVPNPFPPISVDVGGTIYTQPLITNTIIPETMVSAARCLPAQAANNVVLFTLWFELKAGSPAGTYSVGITPTILNDSDAGYDKNGEPTPVLIGADLTKEVTDPLAFPVLLDPNDGSVGGTLVGGSVTFTASADPDGDGIPTDGDNSGVAGDNPCPDGQTTNCDDNCPGVSNPNQENADNDALGNACDDDDDNDGMPDTWEELYDCLDPLVDDADGDCDKDGYTNYDEYILGSDPTDRNDPKRHALPFLFLLLDE